MINLYLVTDYHTNNLEAVIIVMELSVEEKEGEIQRRNG